MTYDFSGKVVLITGGTGALGRAVAQAFSTSNATTVVTICLFCLKLELLTLCRNRINTYLSRVTPGRYVTFWHPYIIICVNASDGLGVRIHDADEPIFYL